VAGSHATRDGKSRGQANSILSGPKRERGHNASAYHTRLIRECVWGGSKRVRKRGSSGCKNRMDPNPNPSVREVGPRAGVKLKRWLEERGVQGNGKLPTSGQPKRKKNLKVLSIISHMGGASCHQGGKSRFGFRGNLMANP